MFCVLGVTESALLVCGKKDSEPHEPDSAKKPTIAPIPKSQGKLIWKFMGFIDCWMLVFLLKFVSIQSCLKKLQLMVYNSFEIIIHCLSIEVFKYKNF